MFENSFLFAFSLTLLTGLSTGIGSLVAFFLKKDNFKFLSFMLGFSAGVMIYVSFTTLLPEAETLLLKSFTSKQTILISNIAFFLGIILATIIDKLVPEPHEISKNSSLKKTSIENTKLLKTGVFVAIILAIHNFPEGLSTFISALTQTSIGYSVALAMALHNIPEGIAVSIPIFYATGSRKKAFTYSFLSGLIEPVGAIFGYFVLFPLISYQFMGSVFAFIAGIMVYISFASLYPLAQQTTDSKLSINGLFTGFFIMAICLFLLA